MANRNYNRRQALEKEVKDLYAKISIGATGAPTLVTGYGFASINRNGAGDYSLVLEDKYASLKYFDGIFLDDTAQDIRIQLHSEDVNDSKEIQFLTLTGATETDPSNGQVILIKAEVKNTSAI